MSRESEDILDPEMLTIASRRKISRLACKKFAVTESILYEGICPEIRTQDFDMNGMLLGTLRYEEMKVIPITDVDDIREYLFVKGELNAPVRHGHVYGDLKKRVGRMENIFQLRYGDILSFPGSQFDKDAILTLTEKTSVQENSWFVSEKGEMKTSATLLLTVASFFRGSVLVGGGGLGSYERSFQLAYNLLSDTIRLGSIEGQNDTPFNQAVNRKLLVELLQKPIARVMPMAPEQWNQFYQDAYTYVDLTLMEKFYLCVVQPDLLCHLVISKYLTRYIPLQMSNYMGLLQRVKDYLEPLSSAQVMHDVNGTPRFMSIHARYSELSVTRMIRFLLVLPKDVKPIKHMVPLYWKDDYIIYDVLDLSDGISSVKVHFYYLTYLYHVTSVDATSSPMSGTLNFPRLSINPKFDRAISDMVTIPDVIRLEYKDFCKGKGSFEKYIQFAHMKYDLSLDTSFVIPPLPGEVKSIPITILQQDSKENNSRNANTDSDL